ncbi:MAG: diaminopimelate epimerase [Planctomycetales bacterium]
MRFTKMHGAGNDYIYVDCFSEPTPDNPADAARQISDRHFGVGGDGLVLIRPTENADARMQMFNADGSEAEMCGNAVRCVAKYIFEEGIAAKEGLRIETGNGVLSLDLEVADKKVQRVRVDMGEPILDAEAIPTKLPGNPVVDRPLFIAGTAVVSEATQRVTCVSMGNPHCVLFVDHASDELVLGLGPLIEVDDHFPNRINVEFVEIIDKHQVRQRTWERGSGETLACGTGASAVCVAGVLAGKTERKIVVHLLGGDLELEWADDNHVYMTGPAEEVFRGEWSPA